MPQCLQITKVLTVFLQFHLKFLKGSSFSASLPQWLPCSQPTGQIDWILRMLQSLIKLARFNIRMGTTNLLKIDTSGWADWTRQTSGMQYENATSAIRDKGNDSTFSFLAVTLDPLLLCFLYASFNFHLLLLVPSSSFPSFVQVVQNSTPGSPEDWCWFCETDSRPILKAW